MLVATRMWPLVVMNALATQQQYVEVFFFGCIVRVQYCAFRMRYLSLTYHHFLLLTYLLCVYQLNVAVSIHFTLQPIYLHVLLGCLITFVCLVMFCVAIEAPAPVVTRLESSAIGSSLFTFRGRYMVDLLISLFLFAMGVWGVIMGFLTLFLIFGIRFLGVKQPDAFNEIFRQSDIETQSQGDSYTLEDTYDTEGSGVHR